MASAATQQCRDATEWRFCDLPFSLRPDILIMRSRRMGRSTKKNNIYKQLGGAMTPFIRVFVSILFLMGAGHGPAFAQKVDPALFGALPAIADAEISPDGNSIAVLQNVAGAKTLIFMDLNDMSAAPKGVAVGDVKTSDLQWVGNDYVLLLTSVTKNAPALSGMEEIEFWRWVSISKDDRKLKLLFKQDDGYYIGAAGRLMATLPNEPDAAIFARTSSNAQIGSPTVGLGGKFGDRHDVLGYSLIKINLKSGRRQITYRGNPQTDDWVVDPEGKAILRIDYDDEKQVRKIFRRKHENKTFELIEELPELRGDEAVINFRGLGSTPNEILASTSQGRNTRALIAYDIETGQRSKTVFENENFDIDYVSYDPRTAKVTAVGYTDELPHDVNFDPALHSTQKSLEAALPNSSVYISSNSADYGKLLVTATYADRPRELYLFDSATKNLAFFSSHRPQISDRIYAAKEEFDFVSKDGLYINGYLTIPTNMQKQNMPLVVLPHGGPARRTYKSFSWWTFYYAARGYAVYQPNYRGSYGYGLAFRRAGDGEWGRKMQDDITEGVQKLVAEGMVDSSRICIVGEDYGGYAAMMGTIKTPGLYQCAVSINGISDLPRAIGESGRNTIHGSPEDYWEKRIGSRFRDADQLHAVSPAKHAANTSAPILLIHGKDNTNVPIYQSEIMRDALAAANKPHEFVALEGQGQTITSGEARTELLRRSIEFIDKHIGDE